MRSLLLVLSLLLAACGRYADFTLPAPPAGAFVPSSFRWEVDPDPVLTRGAGWDSRDVLNPSVFRLDGKLENYYSGFDGRTWRTGSATSTDGMHWDGRKLLRSPDPRTWEGDYIAANGTALAVDGQVRYWYQAGPREVPRIALDGKPVVEPGSRGSWDERGVADPYAIRVNGVFYLYYLGQDRARRQRLGVARSTDGVTWEKLRTNPILELGEAGAFDESGLGEPAVWRSHGRYWMLYTGLANNMTRKLGLARSSDGVHWQKIPDAVFAGTAPWMSKVICDPSVLVEGDEVRVWFGGGDVASRDENLNGQIGMGRLIMLR
jgi:predicted GH43/DUF377 family glycosyl hydrolase